MLPSSEVIAIGLQQLGVVASGESTWDMVRDALIRGVTISGQTCPTCWTLLGTSQDSQETNLNGAMSRHWGEQQQAAHITAAVEEICHVACQFSGRMNVHNYQSALTAPACLDPQLQYFHGRERSVLSAGCHWYNLSVVRWINMR